MMNPSQLTHWHADENSPPEFPFIRIQQGLFREISSEKLNRQKNGMEFNFRSDRIPVLLIKIIFPMPKKRK